MATACKYGDLDLWSSDFEATRRALDLLADRAHPATHSASGVATIAPCPFSISSIMLGIEIAAETGYWVAPTLGFTVRVLQDCVTPTHVTQVIIIEFRECVASEDMMWLQSSVHRWCPGFHSAVIVGGRIMYTDRTVARVLPMCP